MEFRKACETVMRNLMAHGCPEHIAKRALQVSEKFADGMRINALIGAHVLSARSQGRGVVFAEPMRKPAPVAPKPARTSGDSFLADAKRKADEIYREMVRTATGFREIAPNHFVPCEWDADAMLDRQLRARADEIGARILREELLADLD